MKYLYVLVAGVVIGTIVGTLRTKTYEREWWMCRAARQADMARVQAEISAIGAELDKILATPEAFKIVRR